MNATSITNNTLSQAGNVKAGNTECQRVDRNFSLKCLQLLHQLKFLFLATLLFTTSSAFAQDWATYNRTLSLDLGVVQQRYAENDPFGLTTNGVLLTERGTINQLQLATRWQSENLPIVLTATAHSRAFNRSDLISCNFQPTVISIS